MNNKGNGVTFIGPDTSLDGDMTVLGPVLVAGKVKGVIRSTDQIKIEVGGEIDGELFCQELRVSGVFKGILHCNSLVIVSSGVVEGDVSSHKMEIYDGGQFLGARTKGPEEGVLPEASVEDKALFEEQSSEAYAFPKSDAPVAEAPIAQAASTGYFNNLQPEPIEPVAETIQEQVELKEEFSSTPAPIVNIKPQAKTEIKPQVKADVSPVAQDTLRSEAKVSPEPKQNVEAEVKPKSKLEIKPQPNPQAQLAAAAAAKKAEEKKSGSGGKLFVAAIAVAAIAGGVYKKDELMQIVQPKAETAVVVKAPAAKVSVEQDVAVVTETLATASIDDAEEELFTSTEELDNSLVQEQSEVMTDIDSAETDVAEQVDEVVASVEDVVAETLTEALPAEDEVVNKTQVDSLLADLLAEEGTEEVANSAETTETAGNL
ncbi:bactofilin family protein [Shewanella donghaensis]|uniref:bactofilin family protein n=1 Tax=Shewanella donghaensis TaxID=238836 RepID=UPI001182B445|nr:polymer-forming cytoskeletal protein [Shewanella donghaensis]